MNANLHENDKMTIHFTFIVIELIIVLTRDSADNDAETAILRKRIIEWKYYLGLKSFTF